MVRLTIMGGGSTLMVRVLWFFQNKLTYFDLFYYCIKGKSGPKFSHLLMVRLGGVTPRPPLMDRLTIKCTLFLTASLSWAWNIGPSLSIFLTMKLSRPSRTDWGKKTSCPMYYTDENTEVQIQILHLISDLPGCPSASLIQMPGGAGTPTL